MQQSDPAAYKVFTASPRPSRLSFLRKTYLHLGVALLAVGALTAALWTLAPEVGTSLYAFLGSGPLAGLCFIFLLLLSGYLSQRWAESPTSLTVQYTGLGLEVVVWSLLLQVILLYVQKRHPADSPIVLQSGIIAGVVFVTLTLAVLFSKRDFSVLRNFCLVGISGAVGYLGVSIFLGLTTGPLFIAFLLVVTAATILWETHLLLTRYPTTRHVAASLVLLSSVISLFWYTLRAR